MKKSGSLALAALSAGLLFAGAASAATNLATNGSFETVNLLSNGELGYNTNVTGWTVKAPPLSYFFIYAPGTADTTGSVGQAGTVKVWGPGDGSANGLTTSPDGGNFIAADPSYRSSAITQTINGLTKGNIYTVTFDYAGAQQLGRTGPTTEGWQVGFGGDAPQTTAVLSNVNKGFTGWQTATLKFKADGASDVLSFLAVGGPSSSLPPFALLDGVSVTSVPEPATWAVMLVGFGGIGSAIRSRRRRPVAATA